MQQYSSVSSVAEALEALSAGGARVIAGGTDLMIDLKTHARDCAVLVDVTGIPEMNEITAENGKLTVGACCTFRQLETDPLVRRFGKALADAAAVVGSPQIRNMATIGGNVVNAMPAADGAVALFGLDATVVVAGPGGRRELPIMQCYAGIGKSSLDPAKEIVVALRFPLQAGGRCCSYQRFALRKSLALPVVAAAVGIEVRDDVIANARWILAPAGTMPWRAEAAENAVIGAKLRRETLLSACKLAADDAPFRDSPARCSAAYKRLLACTLLRDAVTELLNNLQGEEACL